MGYNNRNGLYNISVTPEVNALAARTVTLNGFVMPLDGSNHTKHFLLTRRTPFACSVRPASLTR